MSGPALFARVASPIGDLLLSGGVEAITGVHLGRFAPPAGAREDPDAFVEAVGQLDEYFAGGRKEFDLPIAPAGTAFQLVVWDEVRAIPYGRTSTYGELAERIGRPGAARAVGAANGANPISILIPCHRLVGSKGELTGYSGGLGAKRRLLDLEAG